jgi:hypothetical protein
MNAACVRAGTEVHHVNMRLLTYVNALLKHVVTPFFFLNGKGLEENLRIQNFSPVWVIWEDQ